MLARIPETELAALMRGYGHTPPFFTAGFDDEDPLSIHQRFAAVLDEALDMIAAFKWEAPGLRVRVVNVVDLMRLQDESQHPHGLSAARFRAMFLEGVPVVFACHGYPWLIHRLVYKNDTG